MASLVQKGAAGAVRGPKYVVKRGKTPVLSADQARQLLDPIDVTELSMFFENVADNFFCYRFLRREKQVVHHRICTVSHRQRLWNKAEAGNLFQSFPEGGNDLLIALLHYFGSEEPCRY